MTSTHPASSARRAPVRDLIEATGRIAERGGTGQIELEIRDHRLFEVSVQYEPAPEPPPPKPANRLVCVDAMLEIHQQGGYGRICIRIIDNEEHQLTYRVTTRQS